MQAVMIGTGAMGSIFGTALARSGVDLVCFDRRADRVEAISREGLRVGGVLGERRVAALATTRADAIGAVDLAVVLVDSGATAEAAHIARACLRDDGFALTLQNGIGNIEHLVDVLGADRVAAGITYNSGATGTDDLPLHTNVGPTVIGEAGGPVSARVNDIAARFGAQGLPTRTVDDVHAHVWSKFVHNCAINPISALTGLRPGEIARSPDAAALLDAALDEILAVVAAVGVRLPEHDPREEIHEHCWERYNRPSMLQHLIAGRRTEIDALNGALVRRASTLGVPAPVNAAIAHAVRALEASGGGRDRPLDEAALEAAARASARAGRWGSPTA